MGSIDVFATTRALSAAALELLPPRLRSKSDYVDAVEDAFAQLDPEGEGELSLTQIEALLAPDLTPHHEALVELILERCQTDGERQAVKRQVASLRVSLSTDDEAVTHFLARWAAKWGLGEQGGGDAGGGGAGGGDGTVGASRLGHGRDGGRESGGGGVVGGMPAGPLVDYTDSEDEMEGEGQGQGQGQGEGEGRGVRARARVGVTHFRFREGCMYSMYIQSEVSFQLDGSTSTPL